MREIALDCLVNILMCLLISYEELSLGKPFDTASNRGEDTEDPSKPVGNGSSSELINQFMQVKQQKSIIENGIDL